MDEEVRVEFLSLHPDWISLGFTFVEVCALQVLVFITASANE